MTSFAGQIPRGCEPLCPQTLMQTFSQANEEEFRRKKPDSKAKKTEYDKLLKFVAWGCIVVKALRC
jgi:hypothetical protein